MKKISSLLAEKTPTFSFELFPPKTDAGFQKLLGTITELVALRPDFISCTYGAGGGNREKTFDIVEHIQHDHQVPGVAHLTCVLNTKSDIARILDEIQTRGIQNVLALRGDAPLENPDWQPTKEHFKYSCELCAFMRKRYGDYFCIGVAGFPEGHVLCPDRARDAQYLKMKIDKGAEYVITQLFFDNKDYYAYVDRLKKIGVRVPILPGILPITNYTNLLSFCEKCGATVPQKVHAVFASIKDDPDATKKAGIDYAITQCADLLKNGAPGIHFYPLNKVSPVKEILHALRQH